jgi:hypothetical protein
MSTYIPNTSVYQSNEPIDKRVAQNFQPYYNYAPQQFSNLQYSGKYQVPVQSHVQHVSNLQPIYHQSDIEPMSTQPPTAFTFKVDPRAQQVIPASQQISESTYYVKDPKNTLQKIDEQLDLSRKMFPSS